MARLRIIPKNSEEKRKTYTPKSIKLKRYNNILIILVIIELITIGYLIK